MVMVLWFFRHLYIKGLSARPRCFRGIWVVLGGWVEIGLCSGRGALPGPEYLATDASIIFQSEPEIVYSAALKNTFFRSSVYKNNMRL